LYEKNGIVFCVWFGLPSGSIYLYYVCYVALVGYAVDAGVQIITKKKYKSPVGRRWGVYKLLRLSTDFYIFFVAEYNPA